MSISWWLSITASSILLALFWNRVNRKSTSKSVLGPHSTKPGNKADQQPQSWYTTTAIQCCRSSVLSLGTVGIPGTFSSIARSWLSSRAVRSVWMMDTTISIPLDSFEAMQRYMMCVCVSVRHREYRKTSLVENLTYVMCDQLRETNNFINIH